MRELKTFGDDLVLIAAQKPSQGMNSYRPGRVTICSPDDLDEYRYKPAISMVIWGEASLTELRKAIDFALDIPSASEPEGDCKNG